MQTGFKQATGARFNATTELEVLDPFVFFFYEGIYFLGLLVKVEHYLLLFWKWRERNK